MSAPDSKIPLVPWLLGGVLVLLAVVLISKPFKVIPTKPCLTCGGDGSETMCWEDGREKAAIWVFRPPNSPPLVTHERECERCDGSGTIDFGR